MTPIPVHDPAESARELADTIAEYLTDLLSSSPALAVVGPMDGAIYVLRPNGDHIAVQVSPAEIRVG